MPAMSRRSPTPAANKSLEVLKQISSTGLSPQAGAPGAGGVAGRGRTSGITANGGTGDPVEAVTLALVPPSDPAEFLMGAVSSTSTAITSGNVAMDARTKAKMQGYEGEACGECGNYTLVRNGTCMKCNTCGATSGCS